MDGERSDVGGGGARESEAWGGEKDCMDEHWADLMRIAMDLLAAEVRAERRPWGVVAELAESP